MNPGRDPAELGANLSPLPLGPLHLCGLLEELPLAVEQGIELLDVASQLGHHSTQLGIKWQRPGGDALVSVQRVSHLLPAQLSHLLAAQRGGWQLLAGTPAWLAIGLETYAGATVSDRRRYPRVEADVFCRPAGLTWMHHQRNTQDISLGGMRVFSDEAFGIHSRLELDVMLPDGSAVRVWAEVVWVGELGPGAHSKFEVGLRFTDIAEQDVQRLASVLSSRS